MAVAGTRSTKELVGLAGSALTTDQEGILALGGTQSQLIESEHLTTSLHDASTSSLGDLEGGQGHLGNNLETLIVSDGSNNNHNGSGLAGVVSSLLGNSREGNGGTVGLAEAETLEDDLVEGGVSATGQEAVELHQETQVHILAGGGSAVALLDVVMSNVDTLKYRISI